MDWVIVMDKLWSSACDRNREQMVLFCAVGLSQIYREQRTFFIFKSVQLLQSMDEIQDVNTLQI